MADWEIWLDDARGNRLILLDKIMQATALKTANGAGSLSILMPPEYDAYIKKDNLIEIWRKPDGGALKLFNVYFLRRWSYEDDEAQFTEIGGPDGNYLATKSVASYASGTSDVTMGAAADDILKHVVRTNQSTGATDTDRDLTDYGLTVAPDVSAAPLLSMSFSYKLLADVFKDATEASRKAGTNLYYAYAPVTIGETIGFDFRTYTGQPGRDLTSDNRVTFGRRWGNLTNVIEETDAEDEATVVYALGRGLRDARIVEEVEDTTRSGASPWARRETSINVSGQSATTDAYQDAGEARLSELRPKRKITGTIIDTEMARFQVHWDFGDRVIVQGRYNEYEAIITSLAISITNKGRETIRATFEVQ